MSRAHFESKPLRWFSIFSPNDSGHLAATHSVTAPWAAVQPRCTSLQNFTFCAIADRLQSPTARLGCRIVCTTSGFAQKKDARPVGGRGISAFSDVFFFCLGFFQLASNIRRPLRQDSLHQVGVMPHTAKPSPNWRLQRREKYLHVNATLLPKPLIKAYDKRVTILDTKNIKRRPA